MMFHTFGAVKIGDDEWSVKLYPAALADMVSLGTDALKLPNGASAADTL